jgi:hypothetical protein
MQTGERECKLWVQHLPPNTKLAAALAGEGAWGGQLLGVEEQLREGWSIVSHSFERVGEDEEGRDQFPLSCILVR